MAKFEVEDIVYIQKTGNLALDGEEVIVLGIEEGATQPQYIVRFLKGRINGNLAIRLVETCLTD